MDKLPVELLQRIAVHLEPNEAKEGAHALSSLCRTSKHYYRALTPALYREVRLETRQQAAHWARTCLARPPLCCLSGAERAWAEEIAVRSLSFSAEVGAEIWKSSDKGTYGTRFLSFINVPDLRPGLVSGAFAFLTSFSMREFNIHPHVLVELFGPFKRLRQQIVNLELFDLEHYGAPTFGPVNLFLFQALDYLDVDIFTSAVNLDFEKLDINAATWGARLSHSFERSVPRSKIRLAPATQDQLRLASIDYPSFLAIHDEDAHQLARPPETLNTMIFAAVSPSPSFFSSLVRLVLHRDEMEEVYLMFYTPLFPKLKRLEIVDRGGTTWDFDEPLMLTFRRSITHDPPGTIVPPSPESRLQDEAAKFSWAPLSAEELAAYPFEPYRGPELEDLDLGWWYFPFREM
ncbi:hypothetical protein JCM6882_002162 [Rhodosporidiobolus microsporus]